MLHITRVEDAPFFLLPHRTSGPKGKVRRNHLPFYRAYATGLPHTVKALIFTSDLQGRKAGRQNRLLGVPVAEALNAMIQNQEIPQTGLRVFVWGSVRLSGLPQTWWHRPR